MTESNKEIARQARVSQARADRRRIEETNQRPWRIGTAILAVMIVAVLVLACARLAGASCHTRTCQHRVAHKAARRKKLASIQPYIPWLHRTGWCETGGWSLRAGLRTATGNGFYGRYQFSARTWWATGARVWVTNADWLEQSYRAVRWREMIGNPHTTMGWPVCG